MTEPRRLLRDERGSAVTEGVVVAFFFAIVFGFCMFEYRLHVGETRVGAEVRREIDEAALSPAIAAGTDEARLSYLDAVRGRWERWVPVRAALLQTVRDGRVVRSRQFAVQRPAYLGAAILSQTLGERRRNDESPRGSAGGNWRALMDTWCRVGMCGGGGASPRPWDVPGAR
jgi:hypothetical protein